MEIKLSSLEKLNLVKKISSELGQFNGEYIGDVIDKFPKLRELLDAYKKEIENDNDVIVLNKLLEKAGNKDDPNIKHSVVYDKDKKSFPIVEYGNIWVPYSIAWIFGWNNHTYIRIKPKNKPKEIQHVFIDTNGLIGIIPEGN